MSHSQSAGPIWASLPLAKYSCVTYPSNSISPPWKHLISNNFSLLIQTLRVVDENGKYSQGVVMKISEGAKILVSQDLNRVVQISQRDPSMVEVTQSSPRLAMRYPTDDGNTQKLQIRFKSNEEFVIAWNVLLGLGLTVSDAKKQQAIPNPRPLESPSPSSLTMLSSSPALGAEYHPRPSSASSSSIYGRFATHTTLPAYAEFKVPDRPATVESLRQRPGSSPLTSATLNSFASSNPVPSPSQSRAASFCEPARQLYLSPQERESSSRRPSQQFGHGAAGVIGSQAKPSISFRKLQMQHSVESESSPPISQPLSKSPFFPSLPLATGPASTQSSDPFRSATIPGSQEDTREDTVPPRRDLAFGQISSTSVELQDMMIPPRRQLPFERPVSTPADLQGLTVPPRRQLPFSAPVLTPRASSAAELPPLPKPTPVTKTISVKPPMVGACREPAKLVPIKRVAQRKAPAPKVPNPRAASPLKTLARETAITPPTRDQDAPSAEATINVAASRPASAASELAAKANPPTTKRVTTPILPPSSTKRQKMTESSTQTQTMSGRDHTARQKAATSNIVAEDIPARAAVPPPADAVVAPPQSFLNDLDTFLANHTGRPPPKELWQRPGYAEADEDSRQTMLNDFICQNLENPEFLKLCTDTERAWRRIGL